MSASTLRTRPAGRRTRLRRSRISLAAVIALLAAGGAAAWYFAARDKAVATAQAGPPPAPPVTVSTPLERSITEWTEYTGQFAAPESVELRARVSGYLTEIHFADGALVHKGDLLFVIDPRPFQIALQQAHAQLETAQAQLDLANREVARGTQLRRSDTIAQSTQDERVQNARVAAAAVETAQAAIRAAELNLEYSRVTAPISGRISQRMVSVGNLVSGGDNGQSTLLTTIVSLDPLWLDFDMSESEYLSYRRAAASGQLPLDHDRVPVQLHLPDEKDWTRKGWLDFVDNQMDRRSGTIRARAVVPNPGMFLTPGQFARLRLPARKVPDALMIPEAAVATDQSRKVVMVVAQDGSVTPKPVQLGPVIDGLQVVRSGLAANDRLVIDGLMRIRPGVKVTPQPGAIAPRQEAALQGSMVQ
jgi:RND family efflux transporter MFP subunit